jgi:hypothetical protein
VLQTIPQEVGVAQIYFNYKQVADQQSAHSKQQTTDLIVASILKQLLQHKALPRELEETYDKWKAHGQRNRPDGEYFAGLIDKCSKEFMACFILLDAFDECVEQERGTVLTYLQQFLECGIKVYITSRPHLRGFLAESFGTSASLIEIKADPADVEKFVTESLKGRRITQALKEDILKVIQKADTRQYLISKSD